MSTIAFKGCQPMAIFAVFTNKSAAKMILGEETEEPKTESSILIK